MSWRGRRAERGAKGAASLLAGATLARAAGPDEAAAAVRRALARVELERPVERRWIVAVGEDGAAQAVAAAHAPERDVIAGTIESFAGGALDAVVAIAPASLSASVVVEQVRALGDALLGVVIVSDATLDEPPAPAPDDAVEALAALERAAGGREVEAPPRPAAAVPAEGGRARRLLEEELERRLADLERRESAFRKVSQVVARRSAADGTPAAANARAERAEARAAELEDRVRALQARVEELEAARAESQRSPAPAATARARPTIDEIERLVARAHERGLPEAEEWSFYLPLLRDQALMDGTLPPQFDSLVESVFGGALSA